MTENSYKEGDILEVLKESEFFIAIAKQGIHSFMMLGVVKDGTNHLLARVGKTNDIDPDIKNDLVMAWKTLSSNTKARLGDEGITRRIGHEAKINYQAYSVTYEQAKNFLILIHNIEKKNPMPRAGPETVIDPIYGFIPNSITDNGNVSFEYLPLNKLSEKNYKTINNINDLSQKASELHINNTCRTTALNMVEAILGFSTQISQFFLISPRYKTTLKAGLPDAASFYILPPPPNSFTNLSLQKQKTLVKLYERIENIPSTNPESEETRNKFNAIKKLYNEISGPNTLTPFEILKTIVDHERKDNQNLFAKRGPAFLPQALGFKTSTERTFERIKKELAAARDEQSSTNQTYDSPPKLSS